MYVKEEEKSEAFPRELKRLKILIMRKHFISFFYFFPLLLFILLFSFVKDRTRMYIPIHVEQSGVSLVETHLPNTYKANDNSNRVEIIQLLVSYTFENLAVGYL